MIPSNRAWIFSPLKPSITPKVWIMVLILAGSERAVRASTFLHYYKIKPSRPPIFFTNSLDLSIDPTDCSTNTIPIRHKPDITHNTSNHQSQSTGIYQVTA